MDDLLGQLSVGMHLVHVEGRRLGQSDHEFVVDFLFFELADETCEFRWFLEAPNHRSSQDKWPNLVDDLGLDIHDCFFDEFPRVLFDFRGELHLELVKCPVLAGEVEFVVVGDDVLLVLGELLTQGGSLGQFNLLLWFHLYNYMSQ